MFRKQGILVKYYSLWKNVLHFVENASFCVASCGNSDHYVRGGYRCWHRNTKDESVLLSLRIHFISPRAGEGDEESEQGQGCGVL